MPSGSADDSKCVERHLQENPDRTKSRSGNWTFVLIWHSHHILNHSSFIYQMIFSWYFQSSSKLTEKLVSSERRDRNASRWDFPDMFGYKTNPEISIADFLLYWGFIWTYNDVKNSSIGNTKKVKSSIFPLAIATIVRKNRIFPQADKPCGGKSKASR